MARAQSDDLNTLQKEIEQLAASGQYAEALARQRILVVRVEEAETATSGRPGPQTAHALGNLGWQALLAKEFNEALAATERGHALAPDLVWIEINRAHLLLFLDRFDEARALYLTHRSKRIPQSAAKFLEDVVDDDFEDFRKSGLDRAAFEGIIAALGINRAQPSAEVYALNQEADRLYDAGRYAEALPIEEKRVAAARKRYGEEHTAYAEAIIGLGLVLKVLGRTADAEPLYLSALAITERVLGPDHQNVSTPLNNLAQLYLAQGRYAAAEPLYKRAVKIGEKALGTDHPKLGTWLSNLGGLYLVQGCHAEAEPLFRRSLAIREKALGLEHREVGTSLNNLAELYRVQGRFVEAEPLYMRALAIWEKVLDPDHESVATVLLHLAEVYRAQRRYAEAEARYERALAIAEKRLGTDHQHVADALNGLAELYRAEGRHAAAEPLFIRSLAIREKALGFEHPNVGSSLNNLGVLYHGQGRYAEAEQLFKRSLTVRQNALGADHLDVGQSLHNLAMVSFVQQDWRTAVTYWTQSTDLLIRRFRRDRSVVGLAPVSSSKSEAERLNFQFWAFAKAAYRLSVADIGQSQLALDTFKIAQWAQSSEAAASVSQMAARLAKGDSTLARLVRERQDLISEWQLRDKALVSARSAPPDKRNAGAEKALSARLAAIDARAVEIDAALKNSFPEYAALANPEPLAIPEVQEHLRADEALILILDTPAARPIPEETFVWVITKTGFRWVRSDLGTAALTREVTALRCGLDATAWDGDGVDSCSKLLDIPPDRSPGSSQLLPFDHVRAHKLYAALFGEVQDLIKEKHLLIVPSGPLTQLPFQVLVTKAPTSRDHRAVTWLAREHAVTVLPAVSSLKALRRISKPSTASRPMLGFGNPLLDGPDARYADVAKLARDKQRCPQARRHRVAGLTGHRGSLSPIEMRGGLTDVASIRREAPLPETADELCAVARDVRAGAGDIRLGAQATERAIKVLSASGELARYRIVHFATHGALAGQLDGTHEPGLILTPPDMATEEDDGYLSASEIASLKLDADWVILSACNTAAGGATNAEALSGLARAFIYAQARALLVSHWAVYSDATVKLITVAVREMARDPRVGRAEALRRSMLALIEKGAPHESHPAYWAPFAVIGEGRGDEAAQTTSARAKANRQAPSSKKAVTPDWQAEVWRQ